MPPKKKPDGASKKTQEKVKDKVIQDKTFGLKNKKGKKQQTFIKNVTSQVKQGGNPVIRKQEQIKEAEKLKKKDAKQTQLEELNAIFKPVQIQQKVSAGADPKSVLCAFFKEGHCKKGNKCKFSHDLSLSRKGEKKSMYIDERKDENDGSMANWSQDKLEEVVKKKHEEAEQKKPKTDIICKYFLEAIDKSLYGWFWTCPNGEKCIYKHALPPGFVLKRKEASKSTEEEISLEELIEKERSSLGDNLTPVSLETFLVWKSKKIKEKKANHEKEMSKRKEEFEKGKSVGKVSGKELFLFKPELAADDDEEATDDPNLYKREEEDDDTYVTEISIEGLIISSTCSHENAPKPPSTTENRVLDEKNFALANENPSAEVLPATAADLNGSDQACGYTAQNEHIVLHGVPVEESLFEEDVDDLELDALDINE